MTHRRPLTALALTVLGILATGCADPAGQGQPPTPPVTTLPPATTSQTSPPPTTPPPPPPAPAAHHVIYTWGLSRPLRGDESEKIGLGWTNPVTGKLENALTTDSAGPQFPYVKEFDVPTLVIDNQHISTTATVDTGGVTIDCTITVDGQIIDSNPGTQAVMLPDGTPETSGETRCFPNR